MHLFNFSRLYLGCRSGNGGFCCYLEVGCFYLRNDCERKKLPESPEEIGTTFLLYTSNRLANQVITYHMTEAQFAERGFDQLRDTKIVIHGFRSSAHNAGLTDIRDAFIMQV